jgi:DNA-binding response OmpR family regulator
MYRVLLVDDNAAAAQTIGDVLVSAGYAYAAAGSGRDALAAWRTCEPDAALIVLDLPDMSGVMVLWEIRKSSPGTACLMIGPKRCQSLAAVIEAMRAGACDWLQAPLSEATLLTALQRALASHSPRMHHSDLPSAEPHALVRLAGRAVMFMSSPVDAATLLDFARATGLSVGGFRNWCRTAGVRARAYVHLARALRVVYRREQYPAESLENLLAIIDKRSLEKFVLTASGGMRDGMPETVDELLRVQRFVSREAAEVVRRVLFACAESQPSERLHGEGR